MTENVQKPTDFNQVCIWPGLIVEESNPRKFEMDVFVKLGVRIKYLETIKTKPDMEGFKPIPNTGGRPDVFFVVHDADIAKFAVPRLDYNIRWLEDAVAKINGGNKLYPARIMDYRIWDADKL